MVSQEAIERFNRGVAEAIRGNYATAIEHFDHVIRLAPEYTDAYLQRGIAFSYTNKVWAILDYNKAIELNPHNPKAYYLRGRFKPRVDVLGRTLEVSAIDDYTKAIELGYSPLYLAYFYRGQEKNLIDKLGAIEDFSEAIRLNEYFLDAYYARAKCYETIASEKTIADYTKILQLYPYLVNVYLMRANCYRKVDLGKAIRDYTLALQHVPQFNLPKRFQIIYERGLTRLKRRSIVDIIGLPLDLYEAIRLSYKIYRQL